MPSQLEPAPAPGPHARPFASRELRLRADPTALVAARDYVEQAVVAFGFDRARGFACVFAVNEALTNAIRYGAPGEEGDIRLRISAERDGLVFAIHSRGPFDAHHAASSAPRPSVDGRGIPEVSSEGGRGLPYMELLMDRVELDLRVASTTVRLYKRVQLAAPAPARAPGQSS